ncbi:SOUL family heme-binding protein [Methylobacterium radiotolerans]|uniref:SOUL heme-binding protein n=1 Tax=Methylobacterium radiotolerans (strain ATCC 27329 / DSM 1819 / JCM 2831 / NBRC 15690 / NCIMB 10815 / 0-1) TaxID=426355 RepID=B1M2J3_METRJ|nr:heme-binding protein [Methylobacterium radiotolerans]ACB26233.1 SOUL heme-binding protein [Methylobacterium radiotolerans JCM 2831]GEM98399.1 SOUL heme-binding protein [Methylobacterium radiotolerans]
MDRVMYALVTLVEAALGIFGVRALYEQPAYTVVARLDRGVEIRSYAPRLAVETDARGQGDGDAFGRLFRYITGANRAGDRIAMTAPVESGGRRLAATVPVEQDGTGTMRFFLPRAVAAAGAPAPTGPGVRLVELPAELVAALRFSGRLTPEARAAQAGILAAVLAAAGRAPAGAPFVMGYDPPFAIPFLRRNEVAVRLPPP